MNYQFQACDEQKTAELAAQLAEEAYSGMVIILDGELGAGKTHFSKAFAKAMGVKAVVNSPTFTLIKEYEGKKLPLYHMDVYRINVEEAEELGLDEYFYGDGVSIVEWGSRITELLPKERLEIRIEHAGEHERKLFLIPFGKAYQVICEELRENGVVS